MLIGVQDAETCGAVASCQDLDTSWEATQHLRLGQAMTASVGTLGQSGLSEPGSPQPLLCERFSLPVLRRYRASFKRSETHSADSFHSLRGNRKIIWPESMKILAAHTLTVHTETDMSMWVVDESGARLAAEAFALAAQMEIWSKMNMQPPRTDRSTWLTVLHPNTTFSRPDTNRAAHACKLCRER